MLNGGSCGNGASEAAVNKEQSRTPKKMTFQIHIVSPVKRNQSKVSITSVSIMV